MKTRTPRSKFTVTTKRGEARTENRLVRVSDKLVKTITDGEAFGINKAARRLKKRAA